MRRTKTLQLPGQFSLNLDVAAPTQPWSMATGEVCCCLEQQQKMLEQRMLEIITCNFGSHLENKWPISVQKGEQSATVRKLGVFSRLIPQVNCISGETRSGGGIAAPQRFSSSCLQEHQHSHQLSTHGFSPITQRDAPTQTFRCPIFTCTFESHSRK